MLSDSNDSKKARQRRLDFLNLHARPVTRRDFVSKGMALAGGFFLAPTVLRMMMGEALAQDPLAPAATGPSYLIFDLAGGAGLPANFLVGGAGGAQDLLPSYSGLGWNPRAAGGLDSRFGLPMAGNNVGRILTGMLSAMSEQAQARTRLGSLLHVARDDTSQNPLSTLSLATAAGLAGSEIAKPLGLRQTESGGNSVSVREILQYKAYYVQNVNDVVNANGLSAVFQGFSAAAKAKLGTMIARLSNHQAEQVLGAPANADTLRLVQGNYTGASNRLITAAEVDPRVNPIFQQIYGIDAQSAIRAPEVLAATLVMNSLQKTSGPSVITIGGCDYHDGTQTTGDSKDAQIGLEIGRAVEAAHRMQVPLFFQVITDGGVYPREGARVWRGDNGEKCMTVVGFYNPTGAPQYRNATSMQIGAYSAGQGADRSTLIGSSPALAAYAAFANYLNVAGRIGEFQTLAPGIFSREQLESVLVFGA